MQERRNNPPNHDLNKVNLRPSLARDFESSEAFINQLGKSVTEKGMFIPMRVDDKFKVGQELHVRFTLKGQKEILAGIVQIVFVRDGSNGEKTTGCGVRYLELTPRSKKNLELIKAWREQGQT